MNRTSSVTTAQPAAAPARFSSMRPGRLAYADGLALQERLMAARPALGHDILLLLEHDPVVTLGRGAVSGNLLAEPSALEQRGIALHRVSRGGDVTYHGPGQLVGYPIVDLNRFGRDLHRYLRLLEELLIGIAAHFGVAATTVPGRTGVWVAGEKLASIGVGVRRWVSWHGFALNVAGDLGGFDAIVPCGLPGVRMTSLTGLLGRPVSLAEVADATIEEFARVFSAIHLGEHDNQSSQA